MITGAVYPDVAAALDRLEFDRVCERHRALLGVAELHRTEGWAKFVGTVPLDPRRVLRFAIPEKALLKYGPGQHVRAAHEQLARELLTWILAGEPATWCHA